MNINTNIVVSNVRFPKDEWLQVKSAADAHDMSINEYFRYLSNMDSVNMITGVKNKKKDKTGYEAFDEFIKTVKNHKGKGMKASEEDKIIYDIK